MRYATVLALVTGFALSVQAQAPSDASLDQMLHYLQVDKLLTQAVAQMNEGIVKAMDQKLQSTMSGHELTPQQTAAIDKFRTKFSKTVQDELSLPKVRSIYVQCYKETFTQQDVDGIIAFYKSPSGQAVAQKYPQVMQKAQTMMQARMAAMSTDVEKDMDQLITTLQETEPKAAAASSSPAKKSTGKPVVDTGKKQP